MKIDLTTLTKASLVGLASTGAEFLILPLFIYLAHMERALAFFIVQALGTLITFVLNKYWAFNAANHGTLHKQFLKTMVVFGGSLVLNTALPSLFTYRLHVEPVLAFGLSQVLVYFAWNYPGNKFWVFRR